MTWKHFRQHLRGWALIVAVALSLACEAKKSSNPLSATVAGPIPGVTITPPKVLAPNAGAKIAVSTQPISLVVENATTSGVRPLSYLFQVALDSDFSNLVLSREGIAPGDGRTTLQLPDALATERTYYWRARAQDGANTGSFSAATAFTVFTPIVISPPTSISPGGNALAESLQPKFTWQNAARSGPVGTVNYLLEVSDSPAFASTIGAWTVYESPNQSTIIPPVALPAGTPLFWRVRGYDPTTAGPWSAIQAFSTPATQTPPAFPPVGPITAGDAIDLRFADVYSAPPDIATWPATAKITRLTMQNPDGLSFEFSAQQTWPNYTPPGWSGPLQYTVWAVVNIGGRWTTSGFIQMWKGRPSTGAPILSDFARNWAYDARWGPMKGYQPHVGEQMGFFLSAGNARGQSGVTSVRERSNVVLVSLPPGDSGVFPF
jgi:hypothetical protein